MKMNTVQDNDDSIQLWQVHELKLFLQPPKVNPSGPAGQLAHIAAEQLSVIMLQVERYSQRPLMADGLRVVRKGRDRPVMHTCQ